MRTRRRWKINFRHPAVCGEEELEIVGNIFMSPSVSSESKNGDAREEARLSSHHRSKTKQTLNIPEFRRQRLMAKDIEFFLPVRFKRITIITLSIIDYVLVV